uniref:Chitin-binding type-2 domain-containing protein n=1 Tax=Musca domestica TaxID=7370 RepID=A0A1I8MLI7_MUSDO
MLAFAIFKFLLLIFAFEIKNGVLAAECNVCTNTTQMACVSETEYQFCVNNLPTGSASSCPLGYVCSTTTSAICVSTTMNIPASCGSCNVCSTNLTFACTGTNTYALCLGTSVPSTTAVGSCGTNLVCNTNFAEMCVPAAAGVTATCTTTTTTSPTFPSLTTPSTLPTYAQYLCQIIRINARFTLPAEVDNTCRNYVYCFLTRNGTWSGQIYTCPGSTYFDPYSRYCVATRPTGCPF